MNNFLFAQILNSKFYKQLLLVISFLLVSLNIAYADIGPDIPTEADAPVDGGLSLLIASGVGLAVRRIRNQQQIKND